MVRLHSQKTYPILVKNPFKAIKNWSKQDKKEALLSVALTTLILAQAEMISLPDSPAQLLGLSFLVLLMSPFSWLLLMLIIAAIENLKEWLERN